MWTCLFVGHHHSTWMMVSGWSGVVVGHQFVLLGCPFPGPLAAVSRFLLGLFVCQHFHVAGIFCPQVWDTQDENLKNAQYGVP